MAEDDAGAWWLVVDDDPMVRELAGIHLAGADIRTAGSCEEAAAVVSAAAAPPAGAALDHRLPDGGGLDLAATLRELGADGPIVIMSGSVDAVLADAALAAGHAVLDKRQLHRVGELLGIGNPEDDR